jgi:hypothetical protein
MKQCGLAVFAVGAVLHALLLQDCFLPSLGAVLQQQEQGHFTGLV